MTKEGYTKSGLATPLMMAEPKRSHLFENARQVEDFLRNKYTQKELYGWMIGEISTIYFQCYQLAYDLAKKAEKTY